jgi:hypothetical protein
MPGFWRTLPTAAMPTEQPEAKLCLQCNEVIRDGDAHLVVSSPDGNKQFMHSACFTETTFDPDRFAHVEAPESDS